MCSQGPLRVVQSAFFTQETWWPGFLGMAAQWMSHVLGLWPFACEFMLLLRFDCEHLSHTTIKKNLELLSVGVCWSLLEPFLMATPVGTFSVSRVCGDPQGCSGEQCMHLAESLF